MNTGIILDGDEGNTREIYFPTLPKVSSRLGLCFIFSKEQALFTGFTAVRFVSILDPKPY